MPQTMTLTVETRDCEVVISRMINAPRELVFEAFTKPEHLARWFGPRIFATDCSSEAHVAGKYRFSMYGQGNIPEEFRGPFTMKGEYLEFDPPSKIVYTTDLSEHPQSWKDMLSGMIEDGKNTNYLDSVVTVTFDDVAGKTKLTITTNFESNAVRDGYVKLQMSEGWSESLDRLEELVTDEGIDREIVIIRVLNAPRELVYQAWTDPKHLEKWWGPNAFTTTTEKFDFREGGSWHHVMHGPDGKDYPNWSMFDTIVPNELISYDHGGGDPEGVYDAQFHATVTFETMGDKTRVMMRSVFHDLAHRNFVVEKYGAIEGGKQHLANLEEYVRTHLAK